MKLYGYHRSSASYRIRILLNVKSIDWEYRPVSLIASEQQGPRFRRINPMGLVPVLEDGDVVLGQSTAIAEYLEESHPTPALLPADPVARAEVREMAGIVGCDIHPLQNLRVLNYLRSELGQDEEAVATWCRRWIADGFAAYEQLAARRSAAGRFSHGDTLTLADAWLIPQVYNARRFQLELAAYPTIVAIDRHCATIRAVADAHPARQPDAPAA